MSKSGTKPKRLAGWPIKTLLLTLALLTLSGCVHVRLANAERLMNRPDFPAAVLSAPEWTRDALKTINQLEHELERR